MTGNRVRRRHSLLTKLLVASVAIVLLAVAATAWLAVRTATNAIAQDQGQTLAQTKTLYQRLLGHAATHRSWTGVGALVRSEAGRLGRRVVLTTTTGQVLADSAPGRAAPSGAPFVTVDALRPDAGLSGGSGAIDARIVGPYRLSASESTFASTLARQVVGCLDDAGAGGRVVATASGRPDVVVTDGSGAGCIERYRQVTFPTEQRALDALLTPALACAGVEQTGLTVHASWTTSRPTLSVTDRGGRTLPDRRLSVCLDDARRTQLQAYAAPAAKLFVTDTGAGRARVTFALTGQNVRQIVVVTGGVLLVAIAIMVLLSRRLTSPLRVLADSVARHEPVAITGRDEIGQLADAFNDATRRRDAAERQRRDMVGDVAHELRNPLTNMRSWLEAAQDGLTPIDTELIDLLHDETGVLNRILADLADLAAADAGTLRMHPEPTDLAEIATQAVAAASGAAEAAGLEVGVRVASPIPVTADPLRVRQLLDNLISNAVRYTPAGGTVDVTASTDGTTAIIEVADTGAGIPPEHLPRVFDRFWRADDSRSRATGGSGLGLAIVGQLVEAHEGTVEVTSAVGAGTTFTVRLPAR